MLEHGALAAVVVRDALGKEVGAALLEQLLIYGVYYPQMVVGMDACNGIVALGREEIVIYMTVSVLLCEQQTDLLARASSIKGDHGEHVLRGVSEAYAAECTGCIVGEVTRELKVALCLIGIPDIDHALRILVRHRAGEMTEIVVPTLGQLCKRLVYKAALAAVSDRRADSIVVHSCAEEEADAALLSRLELDIGLKCKAGISARKGRAGAALLESDGILLRAICADKLITVAVVAADGNIGCKIDKGSLIRARLILNAVLVYENIVESIDKELMLVVALPLELTHELHHSELNVRKYLYPAVAVGGKMKLPYKSIFLISYMEAQVCLDASVLGLKLCIAHTVSSAPMLGLLGNGLCGRAENVVSVLDIYVKAATVGGQMEEAIVVDSPYLRRAVKSNSASRL